MTFVNLIRWCVCGLAIIAGMATPPATALDDLAPQARSKQAALIPLRGIVSPRMEASLDRKLEMAKDAGCEMVILEIDSPGGYLESSLNMATRMSQLDWARTVAFVPHEALSGAAILALGCDEILMAANARMGDAGPIFQGPDALFRHAPEKIRSDLARRVRDLAIAKGRPPALAEAMVDMNLVVFRVTNAETGEIDFMSDPELESSENPDLWEKGQPVLESREGLFLEVNGTRALELNLAAAVVENQQALINRYQLQQPLLVLKSNAIDTAVYLLNLPLVTGLIFVTGLVALYIELSAPGISFGGLVAGLCFAIFFWSRFLGGTAGWLEVVVFLAGILFLVIELFVLPGFGISGITGVLLLAAGVVMASQRHWIPQSPREMEQLTISVMVMLCSGLLFVVAAIVITRYYGALPILNRLVLRSPGGRVDSKVEPEHSSTEGAAPHPNLNVGDQGIAETALRPAGIARFQRQYLDVVTDGSFVEPRRPVRVIRIAGNRIVVREIDNA
jgi:membrane-bound serine protease (ClpP class)